MIRYAHPLHKWHHLFVEATDIKREFAPGKHDCVTWVSDTILLLQETLELPKIDYLQEFRGKYTSDEEGLAIAEARGGMKECIIKVLGNPIPIMWSLDACIVLKDTAVGFSVGRHVALVTDNEVLSTNRTMTDTVWMIPGLHEEIPQQ